MKTDGTLPGAGLRVKAVEPSFVGTKACVVGVFVVVQPHGEGSRETQVRRTQVLTSPRHVILCAADTTHCTCRPTGNHRRRLLQTTGQPSIQSSSSTWVTDRGMTIKATTPQDDPRTPTLAMVLEQARGEFVVIAVDFVLAGVSSSVCGGTPQR